LIAEGNTPLEQGAAYDQPPIDCMTAFFGLGLPFDPVDYADPASEICASLVGARTALYLMMYATDKSAKDALNVAVQTASTRVDSVLAGIPDADAEVAADFRAVWDRFKATRDEEIIPAIYRGNTNDAKKLADGIQFERLSKMWKIMSAARPMTRWPEAHSHSKLN
jgi:hypothetical protein